MDVLLEEGGTPVEIKDSGGCSAMLVAARARQSAVVRRLVQWALPKDVYSDLIIDKQERHTLCVTRAAGLRLHAMIADGSAERVQHLLTVGSENKDEGRAWVEFADSQGRQATHVAVM